MRTRVRWTLTTEAGAIVPYSSVRVYEVDGHTPYAGPIYRSATGNQVFPNPFNAAPTRVEFFLDRQTRVRLGFRPTTGAEYITPAVDAIADADDLAYSVAGLTIPSTEDQLSLRAATPTAAYWYRPGVGAHDHSGPGEDVTAVGHHSLAFTQTAGYIRSTLIGGHDETIDPDSVLTFTWGLLPGSWGTMHGSSWATFDQAAEILTSTPTGLDDTTAAGRSSTAAGRGATALGGSARAQEADGHAGAVAMGWSSTALGESLAIGRGAGALTPSSIGVGSEAAPLSDGVAVGDHARAGIEGVALGALVDATGSADDGSVLLGARASVPRTIGSCVVVGAEQTGQLAPDVTGIDGVALVVQALLSVSAPGDLQVQGGAACGANDALVGFFGATGTASIFIGEEEVASGIEALDSLIYALRDLGLIRSRKDAVARYVPEAVHRTHQVGDQVKEWPDVDAERPRQVTALYREPVITSTNSMFFDATRTPWEFTLSERPLASFRHLVVVAQHHTTTVRPTEGLAGTYIQRFTDRLVPHAIQPLTRSGTGWITAGLSTFAVDGRIENPFATLDARRHVYRVTHQDKWHDASLLLGASAADGGTGWWGGIDEVAALDDSWREHEVVSYTAGLSFLYDTRFAAQWLTEAALGFVRSQQGENSSVAIYLDRDYPSTTERRLVRGSVKGFQGVNINSVPLIRLGNPSIHGSYSYDGALSGYWQYLSSPQDYWIEVYSFSAEFTGTWNTSALVGRFALNSAGTWSTGQHHVPRGNKRWRLVLRSNLSPVAIDEWVPGAYYDTAVKIYTVTDDGTHTLEATVPLQGDDTWLGVTTHAGRIVAELCRRSTGAVLATTDHHLPLDVVPRAGEPDYTTALLRGSIRTAALAALAYTAAGRYLWARAGDILWTLTLLIEEDGSLFATYDVTTDPPTPLGADVFAVDLAWVGIAALAFGETVGDPTRFEPLVFGIAEYLVSQQDAGDGGTGSILDEPAGDGSTETNALAWLFFRNYDRLYGGSAWQDITGDIAKSLDNNHWVPELGRFTKSLGTSERDSRADIFGGLYQLASGQRDRAKLTLRSLAYAKVVGAAVTEGYYGGATGLAGYLPTSTAGTLVLDHELTWAALLLRSSYGDPIGDDIAAMRRWTAATPGAQARFLSYTDTEGGLIARPTTAVAAQALLVAQRTRLFWQLPSARPTVIAARLIATKLGSGGYHFEYEWATEDSRQPVFYEAVAERSFDDGTTWVSMPSRSRSGQILEVARDPGFVQPWLYAASWTEPGPLSNIALTRVRIRMRASEFGSWGSTPACYPDGRIPPPSVPVAQTGPGFPT